MVRMSGRIHAMPTNLWRQPISLLRPAEPEESAKLEVNVIFTNTEGTLRALRNAAQLAGHLDARITLIVPHLVPYPLAVNRPAVSVAFTEQRFRTLACSEVDEAIDTRVQIYLCRDSRECLAHVLKPQSLVVMGGRKRWWPTGERTLARSLRSKGHHVIFVDVQT